MRLSLQRHWMAGALMCLSAAAQAQHRPAVVELFTSEGCSSCPPAEAYVGELAQRPDVLALAFHVDYWDDLGWRDRFGLPRAVQRQRAYAETLGLSTVYTPQIVLDGGRDFVGSNRAALNKALSEYRAGTAVAVTLTMHDGEVLIDLGMQQAVPASDVVLLSYQRSAVSAIGRGENAGRTLKEFNIVRSIQTLGRWNGSAQQYHAPLQSIPTDATDVAVLVQPVGQGPIIGAATHALH